MRNYVHFDISVAMQDAGVRRLSGVGKGVVVVQVQAHVLLSSDDGTRTPS